MKEDYGTEHPLTHSTASIPMDSIEATVERTVNLDTIYLGTLLMPKL